MGSAFSAAAAITFGYIIAVPVPSMNAHTQNEVYKLSWSAIELPTIVIANSDALQMNSPTPIVYLRPMRSDTKPEMNCRHPFGMA